MRLTSILLLFLIFSSCSSKLIETESGLKYKILKKGKGDEAKIGDEILLYETTTYKNGTILYSNMDSGNPIKILIGGNQATKAVDEGLQGMKVGEVRMIIAPPNLVKRTSYPQNTSPDSTLVITMKLESIL